MSSVVPTDRVVGLATLGVAALTLLTASGGLAWQFENNERQQRDDALASQVLMCEADIVSSQNSIQGLVESLDASGSAPQGGSSGRATAARSTLPEQEAANNEDTQVHFDCVGLPAIQSESGQNYLILVTNAVPLLVTGYVSFNEMNSNWLETTLVPAERPVVDQLDQYRRNVLAPPPWPF